MHFARERGKVVLDDCFETSYDVNPKYQNLSKLLAMPGDGILDVSENTQLRKLPPRKRRLNMSDTKLLCESGKILGTTSA